ncbi:alpha/beta hydrolase [Microbulbifer taiwanensis]|uniref:Alpha/beta hydrolase n=1 Tax=Microbulbifer taiwanensis TaxID=986746 RepID=A0ABW1YMM6_9GAMM|nr:alpha/beta hydrolase [Microbulbifer taiwanensis]
MKKELILFVPGMAVEHRGQYLDMLHDGLKSYCADHGLNYQSAEVAATDGSSAKFIDLPDEGRRLEMQEVYWSDLVPLLSQLSVFGKIIRGAELLLFWLRSKRLWQVVRQAKYMTVSMLLTVALVLFWYSTALLAGLEAVASKPQLFGIPVNLGRLGELIERIPGWQLWAVFSGLLILLPTTLVLDISYGTKAYLQNLNGLSQKVKARLARAISCVEDNQDYERITLVAHSFGTVVAAEALADYAGPAADKIRLITLGGPLLVMGARAPRIEEAARSLIGGMQGDDRRLNSWLDFYSHQDWLCTVSVSGVTQPGYEAKPLESKVSMTDKYSGKSHQLYFQDYDVMKAILSP